MVVDTTEGLPAVCSQEERPSVCSATVDAAASCMQVGLLEPPKKVCKIDDETIDDTTTEIWLQLDKAYHKRKSSLEYLMVCRLFIANNVSTGLWCPILNAVKMK